jgi:actin-related protein
VDSFYPYVSSSLILFSQGKTSGLVVESGYSLSYSIPVYEGYSIPFGYKSIPVGGKHILEQLISQCKEENEINLVEKKQNEFFS